ncbi:MAG: hypothetical protein ACYC9O_00230 [Candidatus Latescibacterota bacterium]
MKRREMFLSGTAAALALNLKSPDAQAQQSAASLKAGFAKVKITPPVGTAMTGFGKRDYDPVGSRAVHDDLYTRAIYLSQGNEDVLIMGFDLLFFSRDEADRMKGAIGRRINLSPKQIFLNTSHTHTGPKVGTWDYTPSDMLYLQFVENSVVEAALQARNARKDVTLWAGKTTSAVPMSRRKKLADGTIDFAPNPTGTVCNTLPFCVFKDTGGKPVSILFSISCHPSTIKGDELAYQFSADFPGVAQARLDQWLGGAGSLFLQGAAGDAKASVIGKGMENWRAGNWDDVAKAGTMLADEVLGGIQNGLTRVEPELRSCTVEMEFPFDTPISRDKIETIVKTPVPESSESEPEALRRWAQEKLLLIDRRYGLPKTVTVSAHGVQLGAGVRLIGVEGEIVGGLGNLITAFYKTGVTFPMGYTDGTQMYIPTSAMLDEGGYEVNSYWEYHQPAPLAKGIEKVLRGGLEKLQSGGIR